MNSTHHSLHDRLQVVAVGQQQAVCVCSEGHSQQGNGNGAVLHPSHLHCTQRGQGLLTGPTEETIIFINEHDIGIKEVCHVIIVLVHITELEKCINCQYYIIIYKYCTDN